MCVAHANFISTFLNIHTATKAMNNTNCSYICDRTVHTIIIGIIGFISSVLFLIAVVLVPAFKLHKLLEFRLVLYQVISANIVVLAVIIFWLVEDFIKSAVATAVFFNLVLTVCINFHLFILTVCHKNLKWLEKSYVGSSIIVAVIIFIILVTLELVKKDNLYSNANFDNPLYLKYESIALLSLASLLIAISNLLVVVVAVMWFCRACKGIGIASVNQKLLIKLLCNMMRTLVIPISHLILMAPISSLVVMFYIGVNRRSDSLYELYGSALAVMVWSITCTCALIIRVYIELCNRKRNVKRKNPKGIDTREDVTMNETNTLVGGSETHYSSPIED